MVAYFCGWAWWAHVAYAQAFKNLFMICYCRQEAGYWQSSCLPCYIYSSHALARQTLELIQEVFMQKWIQQYCSIILDSSVQREEIGKWQWCSLICWSVACTQLVMIVHIHDVHIHEFKLLYNWNGWCSCNCVLHKKATIYLHLCLQTCFSSERTGSFCVMKM